MDKFMDGLLSEWVLVVVRDGVVGFFKDIDNNGSKVIWKWGGFNEAKRMTLEEGKYYRDSLLNVKLKGVKRLGVCLTLYDRVKIMNNKIKERV